MKVSFNIPTYNRSIYLDKNLRIIIDQINRLNCHNDVEINISDNSSTDNTSIVVKKLIKANPQIQINYSCNEGNIGPDRNFLRAMNMAKGEYSLLWGDDDFLKDGGLRRIFDLIQYGDANDVQILFSSTTVVDEKGNFLREKNFLRNDIKELLVDFSNVNEARSFFFLVKDTGGLLSFISDVIYKTSILKEIEYRDSFTGTHYAFLCFWWGWLAKGKKLFYSNQPFLNETVQYQPAYGYGVKRAMVDYYGFKLIADELLQETQFRNDFLQGFDNTHSPLSSRMLYLSEPDQFVSRIVPIMRECGKDNLDFEMLFSSCSLNNLIKALAYKIMPKKLIMLIKTIKFKCYSH